MNPSIQMSLCVWRRILKSLSVESLILRTPSTESSSVWHFRHAPSALRGT